MGYARRPPLRLEDANDILTVVEVGRIMGLGENYVRELVHADIIVNIGSPHTMSIPKAAVAHLLDQLGRREVKLPPPGFGKKDKS